MQVCMPKPVRRVGWSQLCCFTGAELQVPTTNGFIQSVVQVDVMLHTIKILSTSSSQVGSSLSGMLTDA